MAATLEIARYTVEEVIPGSMTELKNHVLSIDTDSLRAEILDPRFFSDIEIHIVRPGEDVRVIHAIDVVEPRLRISAPGSDFPGMLSPPSTAGGGRTNALKGVAVTEVAEPLPGEPIHWREAVFDMGGPAAGFSPFSNLTNVVLVFHPNSARIRSEQPYQPTNAFQGSPESVEYQRAIRIAGLKASVYLAQVSRHSEADFREKFELGRTTRGRLPRVAYLYQLNCPYLYGEVVGGGGRIGGPGQLPTLIDPNEVLDGGIVNCLTIVASTRDVTYLVQNHPIIHALYERDGKDVDFAGVVIFSNGDSVQTKQRMAAYAAKLTKMLDADGAIMSNMGGGHPVVDVMFTCRNLEAMGIRTVLLHQEIAVDADDPGVLHFVKEANAVVSTGNYEQEIELPAVSRVLGGEYLLADGRDATGPASIALHDVLGATNPFGFMKLQAMEY